MKTKTSYSQFHLTTFGAVTVYAIVLALAGSAERVYSQSTNYFFQPLPTASEANRLWQLTSHWLDPAANAMFVPNADFNEAAIINNGATAVLTVSSPSSGPDSVVTPGSVAIQNGGLDIRGTGALSVKSITSTTGTSSGNVSVGATGSVGTLQVHPGGTLNADGSLTMSFNNANTLTVGGASGGTATLTANTAILGGTTHVYPNAAFSTNGSLALGATSVYQVEITGASTNGSISAGTSVTVNGALQLNLSGFVPSAGNSWIIVEGDTINGKFNSISTNANLAFNQAVVVGQADVGVGRRGVRAAIEEVLVLEVNRNLGTASITHPGNSTITLDGYFIGSDIGLLNSSPAAWTSLTEGGQLGNDWIETAQTTHNIGELKVGADATFGSDISLGNIYNAFGGDFGEVEDLVFSFRRSSDGQVFPGVVRYTGTAVNSLVLQVDPSGSGDVFLRNASNTAVQIDAYEILSDEGSLSVSGWDSLDQQNATDNVWLEAFDVSSNLLAEFDSEGFTPLAPGAALNLGPLFTGGVRDLEFNFLMMGEEQSTKGVVIYEAFSSAAGDFDGDGDVDGRDFLKWQRGESPDPLSASDLADWQANYGTGSSTALLNVVPEPQTELLLLSIGPVVAVIRRFV